MQHSSSSEEWKWHGSGELGSNSEQLGSHCTFLGLTVPSLHASGGLGFHLPCRTSPLHLCIPVLSTTPNAQSLSPCVLAASGQQGPQSSSARVQHLTVKSQTLPGAGTYRTVRPFTMVFFHQQFGAISPGCHWQIHHVKPQEVTPVRPKLFISIISPHKAQTGDYLFSILTYIRPLKVWVCWQFT